MANLIYFTSAEFSAQDTIIPSGMVGEETDTGLRKAGPGNWNSLPYVIPKNITANTFLLKSTSTPTAASTTYLSVNSEQVQFFTGTTTQTVNLPTDQVAVGHTFTVINLSSGLITIKSSNGNNVAYAGTSSVVTVMANTAGPTIGAHWSVISYGASSGYLSGVPSLVLRDNNGIITARTVINAATSTVTSGATVTMTVSSNTIQIFTGTAAHTLKLPTTSVIIGHRIVVLNKSSGVITITSSNDNTVASVAAGTTAEVIANISTPTTSAHWSVLSNGGIA